MIETRRGPAPGSVGTVTRHGYVDGEIVIRLTPEGERRIGKFAGKPQAPGRLRFGVRSLDALNDKYRATALVPLGTERAAYRLQVSRDANVLRAVEEYGKDPLIVGAEPSYALTILRPAEEPEAVRVEVGPRTR